MDGMIRKSMIMTAVLAIAMTGLIGIWAEEPPLTDPVVTIVDTFAPFDDKNAYVGDTITFHVDGYDAPVNNSNVSVTVKIGPLDPADMVWNGTTGIWEYAFTFPVDPAYVGTHDVVFTATDDNNATNMNITTEQITLWHPVMLKAGYTLPVFTEDTTVHWNLSAAFAPEMDVTGAGLTFGVGSEGFPTGWTFTPMMMDGDYTHWVVTPPANFNGWVHVNVTAKDTNNVGINNFFNLTVGAVNDGPVIEGIMVGETLETATTWNAGNTSVPDMVTAINLSMTEDTPLDVMIHAMDIESAVTYAMTADAALYAVELTNYGNETNVTTVPTNFTITPVVNANGDFMAELNVSDGALWVVVWVNVMIAPVNDAPTATEAWDETYARKTGEEINLTLANIADIDGDVVTPMWYIDGTVVTGWSQIYFKNTWTAAGTYKVSAKISDGTATVDIGYFNVTVTVANTAPMIDEKNTTASKAEITEGDSVTLKVKANDAEANTLTYTWKNDKDASWTATGAEVVVKDLKPGTYKFTVTVSDGTETDTYSLTVTVKAKEDGGITTIIIIVIAIIAILAILIILFFVLRGGKEEEEAAPAETPAEGEEAPTEEEQPVSDETPATEDVPTEAAPEEAPVETGEEVPAPPEPSK